MLALLGHSPKITHLSLFFRALSYLADMVGSRLYEVPRSVAVRYWHHVVLSLFGYLYFERI